MFCAGMQKSVYFSMFIYVDPELRWTCIARSYRAHTKSRIGIVPDDSLQYTTSKKMFLPSSNQIDLEAKLACARAAWRPAKIVSKIFCFPR